MGVSRSANQRRHPLLPSIITCTDSEGFNSELVKKSAPDLIIGGIANTFSVLCSALHPIPADAVVRNRLSPHCVPLSAVSDSGSLMIIKSILLFCKFCS